jgi:hypothetical protein
LSQAIPILILNYFPELLRNGISCPKYVCSESYSRASPFSLIPISALFAITLVCFVLICSLASVLSMPLAERMIALPRQEWLRESASMLLYSTLSFLFIGNCNLHFLKFQDQNVDKARGYKPRTSPSKP